MYILGQICGLIATVITIIMPQFKGKNQMLVCSALVNGLNGLNFLLIGQGGSAFFLCMIAVVQSFVSMWHEKKDTKASQTEMILFLFLYVGFGFYGMISGENFVWAINRANLLELMPIVGALMLMLSVFSRGSQRTRLFLFFNGTIWAIYTAIIGAAAFFTCAATMISTGYAMWKYRKK